jgi:hypothetical protein
MAYQGLHGRRPVVRLERPLEFGIARLLEHLNPGFALSAGMDLKARALVYIHAIWQPAHDTVV